MIKKRLFLCALILANVVTMSGCWDTREINELGLVTAVGIDKGEGSDEYSLTVQIANPSSESSGSGQSSAKSEVWIGQEKGPSLFDATRKLVKRSSRRIMWAHNNVVIIGESMAREGIIPIIDFFTHNPELRMKSAIVISKGDAKDYISAKIGMDNPPGVSFVSLENYRGLTAESVESNILQVCSSLKGKYSNPVIAEISLVEGIKQQESQKSGESGSGGATEIVELSGAAIFKKDKMLDWLTPEECRGISWVLNQTKDTAVTVFDPDHGNKSVVVETRGVKAKIISRIVKGIPDITINISGKGDIVEEDGATKLDINDVKKRISGMLEKRIEDEVKNSLNAVQKKYKVDCLGFAQIAHSQNRKEWNAGLKNRWEEIFPEIPVKVTANINIKSSAINQQPFKVY